MDPSLFSTATVAPTTVQQNHSDSVESLTPSSRNAEAWNDEPLPSIPGAKLRLMCSYGGHIMPRPHDKSLSYIGGETRIVVVDRHSSLKELCERLSHTILNGRTFTLKYQLPNEDLDNLITVTTDEDLDNMIEEYDRAAAKPSPARLRVFLFFTKPECTVSMGSLLDDAKSETWFVDALNNSGILTRVVSDSVATGDNFVNLDGVGIGVSASGSSNNLAAQGGAESTLPDNNNNNNKIKNLPEVLQSTPGSPMMENSSSSSCSSPSVANLPPIRVRVDDNVSRLQQENKVGVMVEEQFAQMTIGATSGLKPDDGFVNVASSAVALPTVPAAMTMTSVGVVPTSDIVNRIVSDDERSDHGTPTGFRKPPLPLQLVQPRTSGGVSSPSPDSVASDNSIASTNSFSKTVYYQEQVQAATLDNKPVALQNAKSEISDQVLGLQREQVQDSSYILASQLDQNQQLQQPLVHANTHYIHHPAAPNPMPVSSYYQVYAPPPPQQQQLHPPIGQQQYPVYVMPVGPTHPYNMALHPNIPDPNVVASGRPLIPQSVVTSTTYKDGTPPIYPTKSATPTIQEVTPTVYKAPVASNPAFVPIPPNQFQPQYVVPQFHHPPQSIAVAPSSTTTNYGYEYGTTVQDQAYYTQQQTNAPLLPQYQSMTPAAAAAALSDASKQFPADNIQQPNRTSQPV